MNDLHSVIQRHNLEAVAAAIGYQPASAFQHRLSPGGRQPTQYFRSQHKPLIVRGRRNGDGANRRNGAKASAERLEALAPKALGAGKNMTSAELEYQLGQSFAFIRFENGIGSSRFLQS